MTFRPADQWLDLVPFEPIIDSPIRLKAGVFRQSRERLIFRYQLEDAGNMVDWPNAAPFAVRQDFLWQHTCFEAFIQQENHQGYVELNFTPRKHWNAYEFYDYRKPDQIPPMHAKQIRLIELNIHHHRVEAVVDLSQHFPADAVLRISLNAVLAHPPQGQVSYWALQHSHEQADFHAHEDRRIRLEMLQHAL